MDESSDLLWCSPLLSTWLHFAHVREMFVRIRINWSLSSFKTSHQMSLSRRSIPRIVLSGRSCSSVRSHSQHNLYSQLEQTSFVSHIPRSPRRRRRLRILERKWRVYRHIHTSSSTYFNFTDILIFQLSLPCDIRSSRAMPRTLFQVRWQETRRIRRSCSWKDEDSTPQWWHCLHTYW